MRDPTALPIFNLVDHPHFLSPAWSSFQDAYYCRHCISADQRGTGWQSMPLVREHLVRAHGYVEGELEHGVHYFIGKQLQRLLTEWMADNELELMRAEKRLRIIRNVDDLLLECGE